jgi:hypothetical protein
MHGTARTQQHTHSHIPWPVRRYHQLRAATVPISRIHHRRSAESSDGEKIKLTTFFLFFILIYLFKRYACACISIFTFISLLFIFFLYLFFSNFYQN